MSDVQRARSGDRPASARFGLSRAALEAAIVADLDEAGDVGDPQALASAVATAIEANNEELLRHVKEMLGGSANAVDVQPDDGSAAR
ncbi:MAG: hypothetical protein E6J41_29860 [Chloroflexi bacterium]|nr:MAG: hypothetical protein E6J41_29860 [Chloroflexota bacterium]